MDIKQLESFVVVAEQGSFSQAARILHISQPSISTHIGALEKELGVKLLNRTTKKVSLTKEGADIYEYALGIFNLTKRIRERGQDPSRQVLQLGASSVPSAYILPEIMYGFRQAHPHVRIALRQSDSSIVVDEVLDGVCDVGVVGDLIKTPQLEYTPIIRDKNVLVTMNDKRFADRDGSIEDILEMLTTEPVIMRESGSGSRRYFDLFLTANELSFSAVHIAAYCNDMEAVKNMVVRGLGISVVPEVSVAKEIKQGELLAFDLTGDREEDMRTFYLVAKKDRRKNSLKQQFINYVKERY